MDGPTARNQGAVPLSKVPTGIRGVDHVLEGGVPEGRLTLVLGGPGAGKTLFGLEFLYRGALNGEPGMFVAFEERVEAVRQNALTLGWDLAGLEEEGRLFLLDAHADPETVVTGEFSLQPMLSIIQGQAKVLGARRIVIDAIDVLLRLYDDPRRERRELFILSDWLAAQGMTALLTAKVSGESRRYEFLDYMANTVIFLDQRVEGQVTTRRLRVVKYRGSAFSRNENPYIIGRTGIELLPISALSLDYEALGDMVPSGIGEFDAMLGGGYRRGSAILLSGTSGSGKTLLAGSFSRAACERGEKVLYINFEESKSMMLGSLLSAGIDLRPFVQNGLCRIFAASPESVGAEEHLVQVSRLIESFRPDHLVLDAASSTERLGSQEAAYGYLVRFINFCRTSGRTLLMTNQLTGLESIQTISGIGISSLVDTVVFLRLEASGGEVNRTLLVLKSRGAKHSNQSREFRISDEGIVILPPYIGEGIALTGVARQQQEARDALEERRLEQRIRAKEAELNHLNASLEARTTEARNAVEEARAELEALRVEREELRRNRQLRRQMRGPGEDGDSTHG